MSQIEFIYRSVKTIIQCQEEEKISEAIQKFMTKATKSKDDLVFIYNGNKLDEELTFKEAANNIDKINNLMKVLVYNLSEDEKVSPLKKSKYIICPECGENSRISINNFQVSLYDCKNGHVTQNIKLKEFEKTQYINQSTIICDICKERNKSESFDNKFFICFDCKKNLCLICKDKHEKEHLIFDYDDRIFYCQDHSDGYICYCCDCRKDLCALCENKHSGHQLISCGSILPDKKACQLELKNLSARIKSLKKDIKDIISKLSQLNESLDSYYEIYNNMVINFDVRKRNYSTLQNINDIKLYNKSFMQKITEIINDSNIKTKLNDLLDLFTQMSFNEEKINEENKKCENEESEGDNKNEKKETNAENNNETIEDKNYYDNIQRYNPFDDKYENFQINKVKELKTFEVKYEIEKMKMLHDRRLLTIQSYQNEKGDSLYKIIVYDLKNDIICDINFDIVFKKDSWRYSIDSIFQMNDDNIIIFYGEQAKIYKIKRKFIEEINSIEIEYSHLYCLLNEKFLLSDWNYDSEKNIFKILSYENDKIQETKTFDKKIDNIQNICAINENEIAIYYYKDGRIYGYNSFLLFYDINNCKEIKTLKLGNYEWSDTLLLIKDVLIVELNKKIALLDIKNKTIKKELKLEIGSKMLLLNDNVFLDCGHKIKQYKLVDFNIKLIAETKLSNNIVDKYPGNQLIV